MRRVKKTPFPDNGIIDESAVLGAAIKASRTAASIPLEIAALTLGIPKQTLADIELGKSTVRFGTYLEVAKAYGLVLVVAHRSDADRILASLHKDRDD